MIKRILFYFLFLTGWLSPFFGVDQSTSPIYDTIIIGAGPAGLGAALVCGLHKTSTLILTGHTPKGAFQYSLSPKNWPGMRKQSGADIMTEMYQQVCSFPIQFQEDHVVSITSNSSSGFFSVNTEKGISYYSKAVIMATGASHKRLGKIENDEIFKEHSFVTNLKKNNTDWLGKNVIVVGSGDDAVNKTLKIAEKALSVTILVRGSSLKIAQQTLIDKLSQLQNVCVAYNAALVRVDGIDNRLSSATIQILENGDYPQPQQLKIPCELIVEALGTLPNSDLVKSLVDCDEQGYIMTKKSTTMSSYPGIFAAGVVSDPSYQQAFIAASEGMKAGYDVIKFLKNKSTKPKEDHIR